MNDFSPPDPNREAFISRPSAVSSSPQAVHPSSASSYANLNFLFGVQDPTMLVPKPNRNRRKSNQGTDNAKHRRTRSGCYTCRSRRVKCDESRPICERCRKGSRECLYPETSTASKVSSGGSSKTTKDVTHDEAGSSSDEYDVDGEHERLEAIQDANENLHDISPSDKSVVTKVLPGGSSHSITAQKQSARHESETPSLVQDKGTSPTPSTEGSIGYPSYQTIGNTRRKPPNFSRPLDSEILKNDWSHLPADLQFYLEYFYENITYLHYSLKYDSGNFLQTLFLDAALRNDALLYAIVGFAAFQKTLHNPEGRIEDFLPYYNKAVSFLLVSLKKGEKHDVGTMLAILQLATIEEFLGDWINLLGHQKAAFEILTEIYTPQTIMQTQMTRILLSWYMRFDVFAGLLGGFQTTLSREWFAYSHEFYKQQTIIDTENVNWKVEAAMSQTRLLANDMSLLFTRMGKGEITREQFEMENNALDRRIVEWKTKMDPALRDSRYLVRDFSGAQPADPDDIVDPYLPGILYNGPLWVMNIAEIDWIAIDIMHKYQTALTLGQQPNAELGMKAYACCQLFEAVEYFPGSPQGTVVACQASLGIAFLFLPRDGTHAMWARRKLAKIEAHGYIYPYTFRTKMADLFRDRSCMHWWLPNDEGYPSIVRSIRRFVEERTTPAKDLSSEGLRDMKAIFASLNLDDGKSTALQAVEPPSEMAQSRGWPNPSMDTEDLQHVGSDGLGVRLEGNQGYWQADPEDSFNTSRRGGF